MNTDEKNLASKIEALKATNAATENLAVSIAAKALAARYGSKSNERLLEGILRAAGRVRTNPIDHRAELRFADGEGEGAVSEELFIEQLRREQPNLFRREDTAAVADQKPAKATVEGPNPFRPGKGFNLTEQMRLMRENPELAKKLDREAQVAGWRENR